MCFPPHEVGLGLVQQSLIDHFCARNLSETAKQLAAIRIRASLTPAIVVESRRQHAVSTGILISLHSGFERKEAGDDHSAERLFGALHGSPSFALPVCSSSSTIVILLSHPPYWLLSVALNRSAF